MTSEAKKRDQRLLRGRELIIEKMLRRLNESGEKGIRGINNLKWNLYRKTDGKLYYNRFPNSDQDSALINKVDPDIVWELEFNEEALKKYYLLSRGWLLNQDEVKNG